jgi:hypothetical protein
VVAARPGLMLAGAGARAGTLVSSFMSRFSDWVQDGPNPGRATRSSAEYQEQSRAIWEDRFLPRLREIVEND